MTGIERVIDLSVEVPGTPEEVWEAIATGPGITSWFIPIGVEEREGGTVTMNWGEYGQETATVKVWDPPRRVVFEGGPEGRALAYEWLVEAKDGGTCVVRLVNSGFGSGDDWDEQFHGMSKGWLLFLENLRLQRTHFPGRPARALIPTVMVPGPGAAAWATLCEAIGVPTDLRAGDRLDTSGDGVPALGGTVQRVMAEPAVHTYFLVLDTPASGTAFVAAEGDGDVVAASVYLYLHGDATDEWSPFLRARFPAPEPAPS